MRLVAAAFMIVVSGSFSLNASALSQQYTSATAEAFRPNWGRELSDLLYRKELDRGYFINADDVRFYRGDTQQFNSFLKQYSELTTVSRHLLNISPGKGWATYSGIPWNDTATTALPCDWKAEIVFLVWRRAFEGKPQLKPGELPYDVTLTVWTGGQVDQAGIIVPPNVEVIRKSEGEDPSR